MPVQIPPIDLHRAAALKNLLGPARMGALLEILSARLEAIAAAFLVRPLPRQEVIASVHQSQGSAGSLGLNELMEKLRALEDTIASDAAGPTDSQQEAAALVFTSRQARQTLEAHFPELRPAPDAGPPDASPA